MRKVWEESLNSAHISHKPSTFVINFLHLPADTICTDRRHSSERLSSLSSRVNSLEEKLLLCTSEKERLDELCASLKLHCSHKELSIQNMKQKMKDLKDIADDGIWELQGQLRHLESTLHQERSYKAVAKGNTMADIYGERPAQDLSLKRNYDIRFAQSRIFGVESESQSFRAQFEKSKRKVLPRASKACPSGSKICSNDNFVVREKENLFNVSASELVEYNLNYDLCL